MNIICKVVGHNWKETKEYLKTRTCSRCNKIEVYAHMSYGVWKWVKRG